jgi:hypothetical protein
MLNKIVILFFLLLFHFNVKAQDIILLENGTLETKVIKLKKRPTLIYHKNNKKIKLTKRLVKYEFPYLYYKEKNDTLKIDVRVIEKVKVNSSLDFITYPLGGFFGFYGYGFTLSSILIKDLRRPSVFFLGAFCSFLSYTLIHNSQRRYDTKEKWSFIEQKKDTTLYK